MHLAIMYTTTLDTTTTITITSYLQRLKRQWEANLEVLQCIDTTRYITIIHTTIHTILITPTTNTTFTITHIQSVTLTAMHMCTTTMRTTMSTLLMHIFTTTGTTIRTTHMSRAQSMIIDVATHSRHQGIKEEVA